MSIVNEIVHRSQEGRLHGVKPTSGPWIRELYAPADFHEILQNYGGDPRIAQLRVRLDVYLNGKTLVIGSGRSRRGDMKKLEKCNEVWEFIDKKHQPSLRVFGRFAIHDVFIATHYRERRWLFEYDS
jgi:hypothetical protein